MERILVATDFSTRSDRALRRASLLARHASAGLYVVHVVDDDQPRRLVEVERQETKALLEEFARTMRETDDLACEGRVVLGDAFQGIVKAADELGVDLIVLGPHRRQILRDSFLGTTAERAIRDARRPVIMASGVPAGPYRSVLIATDFSDSSMIAAQAAKRLGLLDGAHVVALNVFDSDARSPIVRASMTVKEFEDRIAKEGKSAERELKEFIRKAGIVAGHRVIQLAEAPPATAIANAARDMKADLVIVGTHGRTGVEKWLLGSVAEGVLSSADMDVLAVPPRSDG